MQESTEKRKNLDELWLLLNENQRRYCVARLEHTSKKDAAEAVGLSEHTVYKWNGECEEVIKLLQEDAIQSAVVMIKNALAKAAMIKIDGLDSEDEKIRQAVASEILDRQLGKSVQRSELSGPNGGPIETYANLSDADLDAAIAREINSRKDTSQEE